MRSVSDDVAVVSTRKRRSMALTLAGVQIVAVVAWTVFYLFEVGHQRGLTPFDYGEPLYWLLPAVFLLLGSVGLVMVASTPRGLRREPWAIGLFMASCSRSRRWGGTHFSRLLSAHLGPSRRRHHGQPSIRAPGRE